MTKTYPLISFLLLAILSIAPGIEAQPVADLELEVTVDPPDLHTPPGSSGLLTFTVTNHGPDAAGTIPPNQAAISVTANPFPWSQVYGEPIIFRKNPLSPPCILFFGIPDPPPGGDLVIGYSIKLFSIQPGESATCLIDYLVNPLAPDTEVFSSWRVNTFNDIDPNSANNEVTMTYLVRAPAIPTLSSAAIFGLVCLLGLAGLTTIRMRKTSH